MAIAETWRLQRACSHCGRAFEVLLLDDSAGPDEKDPNP